MANIIKAPFTVEQVKNLNAFQQDGFHPFTCPRSSPKCIDKEVLIATVQGWVCECGQYTQDWCHEFMVTYTQDDDED